jgi:hypothetical protein
LNARQAGDSEHGSHLRAIDRASTCHAAGVTTTRGAGATLKHRLDKRPLRPNRRPETRPLWSGSVGYRSAGCSQRRVVMRSSVMPARIG